MAYTGRLRPKGVPYKFYKLQVYKRGGFHTAVEVYKRVGKSVI